MVFSISELQALVVANQLHIHHLIRELQLVYLDNIFSMVGTVPARRHELRLRYLDSHLRTCS